MQEKHLPEVIPLSDSTLLPLILDDPRIRKTTIEGEIYWSILDMFAVFRNSKNPRQDWNRTVRYLALRNCDIIGYVKYQQFYGSYGTQDKRLKRPTPVINRLGLEQIQLFLGMNWLRLQKIKETETQQFHPLVAQALRKRGFLFIRHHVELPSGRIIDFVARCNSERYVIECKLTLRGQDFFRAIGQVLVLQPQIGV